MATQCDVAVIGAGIAGLTAARVLAAAQISVILLEARERVGGRILTARTAHGSSVELGAEFVHGKPKPTLELAQEAGVRLTSIADRHFIKHGAAFREQTDPWQPFATVLARVRPGEPDLSARAFLRQHEIDPTTAERFRQLVEGFEAAPLDEVGIQSLCSSNQHDFSNDPRARGAYSFCRPGGAEASKALSAPVEDALFLAGEATDHTYPGTVAGAIASGQRAAKQALKSLR